MRLKTGGIFMLNKARKLMEQRQVMISEAKEVLAVLGAEVDTVVETKEVVAVTNEIIINKGKIIAVEIPVVKEVQVTNEEETNRLYDEINRHLSRINELAAHNERLVEDGMKLENEICYLQGQILGYKNTIAKLEEHIEELKSNIDSKKLTRKQKVSTVHDEIFDQDLEVTPVVVPSQTKEEETVKETNEVEIPANDNVEVYSSNHGFTHGQVEVEGTKYYFTASNRFDNLVVYGTMDEDIIAKAKYEIIKHYGNSSIFLGYKKQQDEVLYGEDKDNKIVAFCECGVFYGFAGPYYFVWNPTHEVPVGCLINKMYDKKRVLRKMNSSWGKGFVKRGEDIMAVCNELHYIDNARETYEAQQDKIRKATNEVVVNTNDNVDLTDEDLLDGIDM